MQFLNEMSNLWFYCMFLVIFIFILGVGTLATWQEIAQTIEVEEIGMLMSSATSATSMVTSLVNAMPTKEFQIKKIFQVFSNKA